VRRSSSHAWCADLGKIIVGCAAFAALISSAGVRAAEQTAANIDLMQQLAAQVVGELHGKFAPTVNGRPLRLKPAGTSEDYVFVTNVFREELTRLGVDVIEPAPATSANASSPQGDPAGGNAAGGASEEAGAQLTLQYQNVVFDLKYVDSHRAYLVGGKRVDRRAAVRIMGTLTDETGKVVWVGEAARDHSDEIDYGDAARLEQGAYQFSRPVVPSSGWGKVVEPVFVTGVIVGLIYLFFSNQSDN
jgi:hypothetical protein